MNPRTGGLFPDRLLADGVGWSMAGANRQATDNRPVDGARQGFQPFRIGHAVEARSLHATIQDGFRLVKDI